MAKKRFSHRLIGGYPYLVLRTVGIGNPNVSNRFLTSLRCGWNDSSTFL